MRITLGKLVLAPAILAAAVFAATSASAETVNVPFSFTAAGKVWPAGQYSVLKDMRDNIVTLRTEDAAHSISFLLGPGEPDPGSMDVALRFDALGDYHALRDIQYRSEITGRLDKKMRHAEELRASGR
jgi:hypothetical protein